MSHNPTDCLSHIIGLSRTNCSCFDSGKPGDAVTSDSGIYLDEQEGLRLNMVDAVADCEAGGMWDILSRARENGIGYFKQELMALLLTKDLKNKREPFKGIIGEAEFKNSLSVLGNDYAGIRIVMQNTISGVMTIHRIGLVFETIGTFDISVYNNFSDTPINTYTVTSKANGLQWVTLPTPLELAMNDDNSNNPQYYILYTPSLTPNPKDIKGSCGCGDGKYSYYFNPAVPVFKSYTKYRWSEFIMLGGTKGNTISDRLNWGVDSYLNGIMLDAEFDCNTTELICKQNFNYNGNGVALAMAYAIRFRSAAIVIDEILGSSQINRYTMMDRETMSGKRNNFVKEYQARMNWIADKINWRANDCLACDDFNSLIKVGIFS